MQPPTDFDDLLEQLLENPPAANPAPEGHCAERPPPSKPVLTIVPTAKPVVAKLNYSHDGMINLIIANRGISQNALAAHFGYSASWVSQVMSSDAFQARLIERAAELEDPTIKASIEDGLKGMAARSMEILKQKLAQDPLVVPDNLALRTLDLTTRALGYGAREAQVNVQVNVDQHLEKLGDNMTKLLARRKLDAQVIDVDVGDGNE